MKKFWFIFFLIIMALPLCAYIDPMSGSTILYLAAGLFAALFYGLRGFFYRLVNLWKGRGFITRDSIKNCDIIFYSEGKQYWHVFLPIIKALEKKNVNCAYLTSDKMDPGLEYESEFVYSHYLGGMAQSWSYLNNIQATVVIMTTPQLDIMTLKKSKGVKHYSHVLHSPTDIHTYRKFAFDYFDSVLCSGPYQIKSIRDIERIRKSEPKLLLETGLTYFDIMSQTYTPSIKEKSNDKTVVLIAPTWQPFCILNRFGIELIDLLLSSEQFHILLRPHPQSYVSYPDVVKEIEDRFCEREDFEIDKNASGIDSLNRADVMISDVSGVVFDFAFIHDKPVVFFDVPFTGKGMEASNLSHTAWELQVREHLGALVDEDKLSDIAKIVKDVVEYPPVGKIDQLRTSSVYNFGRAGEKAAEQILDILESVK